VIEPGANWQRVLQGHVHTIFTNVDEVSGAYDLFLSSHSMEHVADIRYYMSRIAGLVSDDGYLIIEVPNSEEADVIFDRVNPDYHIPHTYFFTPTSFKKLAQRYGLQVMVLKTFNRSYTQILTNIQTGINGKMENPKGAYLRVVLKKTSSSGPA
jgi:2-polyprenyl-3-methyl-5-hydroxy-6-metoxy-1,4-benzoquinol methylase